MSSQTHTPGPWQVHYHSTDGERDAALITDADGWHIASLWHSRYGNGRPLAEVDANARLIAAAPEMKTVLEAALYYWQAALDDENLEVSGADMVEWFFGTFARAAQAAVAAATGGDTDAGD